MEFKKIRTDSGMSQSQFSKYFGIPLRTVQSWEYGERKCPEYVIDLIQYKLDNEKKWSKE